MPETVSILSERRISLPTAPGVTKEMIALTYATRDVAPRIVYIDPDHDSPEERKRVVSEDLKQARTATPQTLEL